MTNYQEVGGGAKATAWNDKNLAPGGTIEGRYIEKRTNVGPNKSNMYILEKDDSSIWGVWGSTVIDGKFDSISVGKMVKVVFDGKKTGKNGKDFKAYSIFQGVVSGTDEGKVYENLKSGPLASKKKKISEDEFPDIDEEGNPILPF